MIHPVTSENDQLYLQVSFEFINQVPTQRNIFSVIFQGMKKMIEVFDGGVLVCYCLTNIHQF